MKVNVKNLVLDRLIATLYHFCLTTPVSPRKNNFSIITFHRVLPENLRQQYPLPGLVVTPDELFFILSYCRQFYNCGTFYDTWEKWQTEKNVCKPFLAITFDDGQKDNYTYALPVLEKLGIKATFFVPVNHIEHSLPLWHDVVGFFVLHLFKQKETKNISIINELLSENFSDYETPLLAARAAVGKMKMLSDKERIASLHAVSNSFNHVPDWAGMMSWETLRIIDKKGHEVGSHTLTHPILPKCSNAEINNEISMSKTILQAKLNKPINSLCYPNGDYDERVLTSTKSTGYECAVTTQWKLNRPGDSQFTLGRFDMISSRIKSRVDGDLSLPWLSWRLSSLKCHKDQWKLKLFYAK